MSRSNHRNSGFFYTLGTYLGRPLAWILRKEQPVVNWLVRQGCSVSFAKKLLTVANLFILISILFAIIPNWFIALVLVLAFIAYSGIDFEVPNPKQPEWRSGTDGFGYYNDSGLRVDGGSIKDEDAYTPRK